MPLGKAPRTWREVPPRASCESSPTLRNETCMQPQCTIPRRSDDVEHRKGAPSRKRLQGQCRKSIGKRAGQPENDSRFTHNRQDALTEPIRSEFQLGERDVPNLQETIALLASGSPSRYWDGPPPRPSGGCSDVQRRRSMEIRTIGIDLGKAVFTL